MMSTGREEPVGASPSSAPHAHSIESPASLSVVAPNEIHHSETKLGAQSTQGVKRQYLASLTSKISGRSQRHANHSRPTASEPVSSISNYDPHSSDTDSTLGDSSKVQPSRKHHHVRHHPHLPHHSKHAIVSQVTEWLHQEKSRQAARRSVKRAHRLPHLGEPKPSPKEPTADDDSIVSASSSRRSSSDSSESSLALRKLEHILTGSSIRSDDEPVPHQDTATALASLRQSRSRKGSLLLRRKHSLAGGLDRDGKDILNIPSAEVILDNSKVCTINERRKSVSEDAVAKFKREIVRLTHTLGIPGWRRVHIKDGDQIDVSRLSGALTNAVYVVKPPPEGSLYDSSGGNASSTSLVPKRRPGKLLLRIYGPQVEHLIDRDSELQILRRLCAKKIGPTLLGIFTNGRFEQFLEAKTLTAQDIRDPQTSVQIAKRMRELHEGIELLKKERDAGAFVWQNWDKYKERCEEVIGWLDEEILAGHQGMCHSKADQWKKRGLVCGVEWPVFRAAVRKYRDWLYETCGGTEAVRDRLIFAHNDTQYGNLMRMQPSGESPLLLPENTHRQLVVIDFEYANANVPGMEFANHFTEWCYDYHQEDAFALHEGRYPTLEEQRRFLKAYVQHVSPIQTRRPEAQRNPSAAGSISQFVLDSRIPRTSSYADEEAAREEETERAVQQLLHETRIWRMANAAQWVAWGIVQAKVPNMDAALEARQNRTPTGSTSKTNWSTTSTTEVQDGIYTSSGNQGNVKGRQAGFQAGPDAPGQTAQMAAQADDGEDEDEFDYLAYAQERALLFWGDALQLGVVGRDELPQSLLERVKLVDIERTS